MIIDHRFKDGIRLSDREFDAFRRDIARVVEQRRTQPSHRSRPNSEVTIKVFIMQAALIARDLHALNATSFAEATRRTWDAWAASIRARDPTTGRPRLTTGYQRNLFNAAMMLWYYRGVMERPLVAPPIVGATSAELAQHDQNSRKTLPLSDSELDRLGGLCWGFVMSAPYILDASRVARDACRRKRAAGRTVSIQNTAARRALQSFLRRTEAPSLPCPLAPNANLKRLRLAQIDLAVACTLLWNLFSAQRGAEIREQRKDCLIAAPWSEDGSQLAIRSCLRKGVQIPGGINETWSATPEHEHLARIFLELHAVQLHERTTDYLIPRFTANFGTDAPISAANFEGQLSAFLGRHPIQADDGRPLRLYPGRLRVTFSRLFAERDTASLHLLQWQLKHEDEVVTELFYWNRSADDQARRLGRTRLRDVLPPVAA